MTRGWLGPGSRYGRASSLQVRTRCCSVMYWRIRREISWAWSVWRRVILCCIRLPHFMSRNSVPSSDLTLRVEITSEKGWCRRVSCQSQTGNQNTSVLRNLEKMLLSCEQKFGIGTHVGHNVDKVHAVTVECQDMVSPLLGVGDALDSEEAGPEQRPPAQHLWKSRNTSVRLWTQSACPAACCIGNSTRYSPSTCALAWIVSRPCTSTQLLCTMLTHCAGLMSRTVSAGLGSRNLVSFMAGTCPMSAARCSSAAILAISYCKKVARRSG